MLLYDKAWVVFRPDVIINPKIGVMWKLTLDLKRIVPNFTTNTSLLRFLQMRYNSRQLQLDLFKKFFSEKTVTLAESATLFDISNDAYRCVHFSMAGLEMSVPSKPKPNLALD